MYVLEDGAFHGLGAKLPFSSFGNVLAKRTDSQRSKLTACPGKFPFDSRGAAGR
jgi:hypothetical protein